MKETGVCPKCGGSKVLKVDPMRCNAFPIGFTSLAKLERWFCGSCGFTEEWIQEADLEKAVKFWGGNAPVKGATDEEDKRMPQVWGNRHRKGAGNGFRKRALLLQ